MQYTSYFSIKQLVEVMSFLVAILFGIACCVTASYSGLSDNIHFSINWAGPLTAESTPASGLNADNALMVMTRDKEQYHCLLPQQIHADNEEEYNQSHKQTELELLKSLFQQTTCSYRLETYWTYELCNGKYLRQFHQDTESQKLQEYYLGRYNMDDYPEALKKAKEESEGIKSSQPKQRRLRKVNGLEVPYYEVWYTDGTPCDLTGEPRRVSVQYVCQTDARGEVYELKETSSCEYEAVVLTSLLCQHPNYGPKKRSVSTIQCHSVDQAPLRPISLDSLELENTVGRYNSQQGKVDKGSTEPDNAYQQPMGRARVDQSGYLVLTKPSELLNQATEQLIVKDFLEGTYCVQGGTGWWKHEFCYGKQVTQFHDDRTGRVNVVLGVWDSAKHVLWLSNHPSKKPKPVEERLTITQFYSDGEVCDVTGQKRFVEVRLKCSQSASHPSSIALYLVEPKPCEYKLVVESQILCPLIKQANSFGLIPQQDNL